MVSPMHAGARCSTDEVFLSCQQRLWTLPCFQDCEAARLLEAPKTPQKIKVGEKLGQK